MARPSPYFDLLDEHTQERVRGAVDRCTFRHCTATYESVATDIIRSRARLRAAKQTDRTDTQ